MKRITFIFYFGLLLFAFSCSISADEEEIGQAQVKNNVNATKPTRTDWAFIAQQLVERYKSNYGTTGSTLAQKITRLDSVSFDISLYNDLKPINFSVPTTTEAQVFLTNYETAYSTLSVSLTMQSYLTAVLQEDPNYDVLLNTLQTDVFLTDNETEQLKFIVMHIKDTTGLPEVDIWKKRKIVAAIKGFEKSTANALFNTALLEVSRN